MPKRLEKTLWEMPGSARRTLFHLVNDIRETGPDRRNQTENFSNMGHNAKPISRKTAYQLSEVFGISPCAFT
jgi:hypothetical protein